MREVAPASPHLDEICFPISDASSASRVAAPAGVVWEQKRSTVRPHPSRPREPDCRSLSSRQGRAREGIGEPRTPALLSPAAVAIGGWHCGGEGGAEIRGTSERAKAEDGFRCVPPRRPAPSFLPLTHCPPPSRPRPWLPAPKVGRKEMLLRETRPDGQASERARDEKERWLRDRQRNRPASPNHLTRSRAPQSTLPLHPSPPLSSPVGPSHSL